MPVRILVVDDNPFDRELAARALRELTVPPGPVELHGVADWSEAESLVADEAFDLVLLDYHLPTLSGLDVLHALGRTTHPPVIMMTGQDDVVTAVETLRAGARDYVAKSANWGPALRLAVERVLERVHLERELEESRVRLAAYAADLEGKVATRTAVVRAQAAEIEHLYLKAEEVARVKAEIVANVSHELRTPLNVILGYTELIEDQVLGADADTGGMVRKVREQADHLRMLVDTLLAMGRLEAGHEAARCVRFPLPDLVCELQTTADALNQDRGLVVAWHIPADPVDVEHDREKVRMITYQLLSNAIKFTHVGRVDVAFALAPNGTITLTVRDTGIGMAAEGRETAFEDFRQLDGSTTRRYDGLGLGLGIVQRYATLLGGSVALDSAPNEGTTVTVVLPRPVPPVRAPPPAG